MFGLGMPELLIILVIVVIIFGASKLPQIGSGIGKGIRNFRKNIRGDEETPSDQSKIEEKNKPTSDD
ncbi:MAG: twin-arginine translocase TatA/TatE family subunit [Deltaproteobacteria bacterium]|nr:MAG: twin-arginine translocase TatA/TatE family subunit [Deltaproteobacteria bacterium]